MRYKIILPCLSKLMYHFFGRHKLHNATSDLSCTPFFILGSGRNGSSLLSMILNSHSAVFIPPEQHTLHYNVIRFQLYNFLIWRDLVKLIIGEFADDKNNQGWNANFNRLYNKIYTLAKSERAFQKIVDMIIEELASQHDEKFVIWGDKSAMSILFIEYIYRAYPNSKYINLIRDGRDVVSSYIEGGEEAFGDYSDAVHSAKRWKKSLEKWKWLTNVAKPEQLLEIKYEDLVSNPDATVRKICLFLEIDFESEMLEIRSIVKKRNMTQIKHYRNLSNPINISSIGKWRRYLNEDDMTKIQPIIERQLSEYGYV